jgi:hypothetical protein
MATQILAVAAAAELTPTVVTYMVEPEGPGLLLFVILVLKKALAAR